jgi:hypothetical protein
MATRPEDDGDAPHVVDLFTAGVFHMLEQQVGRMLADWKGKRPKSRS